MSTSRTVLVSCRFTRGDFAHNRKFWIKTPDGRGEYSGLAFIRYCLNRDRQPLKPEEPPEGQTIDGLLEARVIGRQGAGRLTVQVPDGELCDIDEALVEERNDVPIGP